METLIYRTSKITPIGITGLSPDVVFVLHYTTELWQEMSSDLLEGLDVVLSSTQSDAKYTVHQVHSVAANKRMLMEVFARKVRDV